MSDSFFKAIADANRRKILFLLKKRVEMSAGEISENFEISKPALSDHLKILKNADLIASDKRGQFIYYSLNTSVFEDVAAWIMNFIEDKEETK